MFAAAPICCAPLSYDAKLVALGRHGRRVARFRSRPPFGFGLGAGATAVVPGPHGGVRVIVSGGVGSYVEAFGRGGAVDRTYGERGYAVLRNLYGSGGGSAAADRHGRIVVVGHSAGRFQRSARAEVAWFSPRGSAIRGLRVALPGNRAMAVDARSDGSAAVLTEEESECIRSCSVRRFSLTIVEGRGPGASRRGAGG